MRLAATLFVVSALGASLASSLLMLSFFRVVDGIAVGIASVIALYRRDRAIKIATSRPSSVIGELRWS